MGPDAKPDETPEAFLDELGKSLIKKVGADTELAVILRDHILTVAPAKAAVAAAKVAITKLAAERTMPPQKLPTDG